MWHLSSLLLLSLTVHFVDIAQEAGLHFRHVSGSPEKNYILETIGGGVAWIDYNRDGWPDLFLVNGGRWEDLLKGEQGVSSALYRNNRDGTFTDVTKSAGLRSKYWGMGVAVGDYNNDGWPDLYICNYGSNMLYRNNGDGTFSDVSREAGVGHSRWSSSAAFADYDGDGWLDLYVTNYLEFDATKAPPPNCQYRGIKVHCGPKGMIPAADILYRNRGDGSFSDVTQRAGVKVQSSYGLGAIWGDYDNDGDSDLYVANDSMANFLFQNQGDGTFLEMGLPSGVAYNEDGKAQAGMGVAWGDYDNDGHLDLYVTNFSDDYNTLYRNEGDSFFRDMTYAADLAFPTWQFLGWGTGFFDFNNDGWGDLFVSNGHIYPQVEDYQIGTHFRQRNLVFQNLGTGKFKEVGEDLIDTSRTNWSSRGSAFADFDNDGDIDIAINNIDASPSLLRNEGGNLSGHWLILELEGVRTNRSAIGARVTIETSEGTQSKEVAGGGSYQATDELRLHFGLGSSSETASVTVRWTDGRVQEFKGVKADQRYALKEGEEELTADD
ncbi:CRTAC1 family protein [Acidobacteria bacterium AH-259-D05]|nr:CRTAC1 family protein [Acidobacteria bacterium AH-259-D05]